MHVRRAIPLLVVLVSLVAPAAGRGETPAPLAGTSAPQADTQQDEFRWTGQVAAGQSVEIKGVNGAVRAEPSQGAQVEVVALKQGRRSDPKLVRIEVVPHGEGVTLCAVYPSPDAEPNECRPGREGRMNTRDNDVKVDFTVRVPAGVNFFAKTVNGSVEARGLDGRVALRTVNGSIVFDTNGSGEARTVNGSITGTLGRADWSDTVEFKTVNGSITIGLPQGVDTELDARTVNGRVHSDLPFTLREMTRRTVKGTIGSGGRGLSLETVNGSITLKNSGG